MGVKCVKVCKLKSVLNRGSCGPSSGGGFWPVATFTVTHWILEQVKMCQWQFANLDIRR